MSLRTSFQRLARHDPDGPNLRERGLALAAGLARLKGHRSPLYADAGRRAVMSGAFAAAVPLPALAAPDLAQPNPDAVLIDLWNRREVAHRIERAALERSNAIDKATHYPDLPEAMFLRKGDDVLRLAGYAEDLGDDRRRYPFESASATRRGWRRAHWRDEERRVTPEDGLPADAHTIVRRVPWPEAQTRADEIAVAWEAYRAACAEIRDASGADAANDAWEVADDAVVALDDAIADAPAHTLRGLTIKAQLAQWDIDEGEEPSDVLIHGLVRDLIAFALTA